MEVTEVDIRVMTKPITVELDCPHCDAGLEWSYEEFLGIAGEPCDWRHTKLICSCCNEKLEIDCSEWL